MFFADVLFSCPPSDNAGKNPPERREKSLISAGRREKRRRRLKTSVLDKIFFFKAFFRDVGHFWSNVLYFGSDFLHMDVGESLIYAGCREKRRRRLKTSVLDKIIDF